jgi:hypothetical protein
MNLSLGRNFGKRCFFDKNKPINYYVYTAFEAVFGYVEYLGDRPMVGQRPLKPFIMVRIHVSQH